MGLARPISSTAPVGFQIRRKSTGRHLTLTMKVINSKSIKSELDDKAWTVAKFIQELSKVQDDYFERLVLKATAKGWYGDMSVEEFREWLFDYAFNSGSSDGYPECAFSEYLPSTHKEL